MKYDDYGQAYVSSRELIDTLYQMPDFDLRNVFVTDPDQFNSAVSHLHLSEYTPLKQYQSLDISIDEFDANNQNNWYMPEEYLQLDIAQWVLDQCKTPAELQRVGQELLMYQERNLMNLLRYLKYFVDTMRTNRVLWGLGRGSSVASYVLYKIGVHKIDSMYYDLPIEEFLKS
jgi:DNA polymerase-3 subunit alpha